MHTISDATKVLLYYKQSTGIYSQWNHGALMNVVFLETETDKSLKHVLVMQVAIGKCEIVLFSPASNCFESYKLNIEQRPLQNRFDIQLMKRNVE